MQFACALWYSSQTLTLTIVVLPHLGSTRINTLMLHEFSGVVFLTYIMYTSLDVVVYKMCSFKDFQLFDLYEPSTYHLWREFPGNNRGIPRHHLWNSTGCVVNMCSQTWRGEFLFIGKPNHLVLLMSLAGKYVLRKLILVLFWSLN